MIGSLFELINFSIFASLLIYMIKKYLMPQLREALVKKFRDQARLIKEHDLLAVDQKNIEERIECQEDEAMTLFKKINKWRNVVAQQKKQQELEQTANREQAHTQARKKLDAYMLNHAYDQLVPLVAQQLNHDMKKQFQDAAKGHAYLTKVLTEL